MDLYIVKLYCKIFNATVHYKGEGQVISSINLLQKFTKTNCSKIVPVSYVRVNISKSLYIFMSLPFLCILSRTEERAMVWRSINLTNTITNALEKFIAVLQEKKFYSLFYWSLLEI